MNAAPKLGAVVSYSTGGLPQAAIVIRVYEQSDAVDLFVFSTQTTVLGVAFDSGVVGRPPTEAVRGRTVGTWVYP